MPGTDADLISLIEPHALKVIAWVKEIEEVDEKTGERTKAWPVVCNFASGLLAACLWEKEKSLEIEYLTKQFPQGPHNWIRVNERIVADLTVEQFTEENYPNFGAQFISNTIKPNRADKTGQRFVLKESSWHESLQAEKFEKVDKPWIKKELSAWLTDDAREEFGDYLPECYELKRQVNYERGGIS